MPAANRTFSIDDAPEVFFTSGAISHAVRRALTAGRVRQIGPRLYTKNLDDDLADVVKRNIWSVVGGYFPDGVVSDRTALDRRPTEDGTVFLVADIKYWRTIELPGLTIRVRPGPGPQPGDTPFIGLHISSDARAFLDNMRTSRRRSGPRRTLSRAEIEKRLDAIASRQGPEALNDIRDQARKLAGSLSAAKEFAQLDELIGGLYGTRTTELKSRPGKARGIGRPYDTKRIELFDILFAELSSHVPVNRPERKDHTGPVFGFYEAYFSNYIEGTEFLVEEAKAIVFEGVIPSQRPKDAHDILGTFRLITDPIRSRHVARDIDSYLDLLRENHHMMLSERMEARPGEFKEKRNQAGGIIFVKPELVQGTLAEGFERQLASPEGFLRAVFQMFLVSEVHPFDDGNGRLARAMLNAELSAAGQQRIMTTTSQRDAYVRALRALSYNKNPEPLVRVLEQSQEFSARGDWSSDQAALRTLKSANAFEDPHSGGAGAGAAILGAIDPSNPETS